MNLDLEKVLSNSISRKNNYAYLHDGSKAKEEHVDRQPDPWGELLQENIRRDLEENVWHVEHD